MVESKSGSVPRASDLMEEIRMTFAPDMDLMQAIEELARHGVSAAPVVDSQRCLRGILTEKDCLRLLYDSALHRSRGGRVADFMSELQEAIDLATAAFPAGVRKKIVVISDGNQNAGDALEVSRADRGAHVLERIGSEPCRGRGPLDPLGGCG